jgi:hypothetical protein
LHQYRSNSPPKRNRQPRDPDRGDAPDQSKRRIYQQQGNKSCLWQRYFWKANNCRHCQSSMQRQLNLRSGSDPALNHALDVTAVLLHCRLTPQAAEELGRINAWYESL